MSRRSRLDCVVVGGGVVGSACALALAREGLQVTLVEAAQPQAWSSQRRDLRVYAFAPDNAVLLDALDVWESVRNARAQPYRMGWGLIPYQPAPPGARLRPWATRS